MVGLGLHLHHLLPSSSDVDASLGIGSVISLPFVAEPNEISKKPIRTRYLGHVTGYQPIRDQYFLIRHVLALPLFDTGAEWYRTVRLVTPLRMETAQGNELLTNRATTCNGKGVRTRMDCIKRYKMLYQIPINPKHPMNTPNNNIFPYISGIQYPPSVFFLHPRV
eukprot:sb/3472579/